MSAILTGERAVAAVRRDYAPWRVEWPDGTVIDGGGRDALISVDQACKARPGRPAEMVCTFPEVDGDGCLHHWQLKARFLSSPDGKILAGEVWTPQDGWFMPRHAHPGLDLFRPLYYRIVDNRPAVEPELGSAVVVDLRARPTRTGNAHAPVVVLGATSLNTFEGNAGGAMPNVDGLVIVVVDRDPQLLFWEPVTAVGLRSGEQFPGEGNRTRLEVVTK